MYVDGEYVEAYNSAKIEEKINEILYDTVDDICMKYGVSVDTSGGYAIFQSAANFLGIYFNDYTIFGNYKGDITGDDPVEIDGKPRYLEFKDTELVLDYLGLDENMDMDAIDQKMKANGYSFSDEHTNDYMIGRYYKKDGLTCLITANDKQGTGLDIYFSLY